MFTQRLGRFLEFSIFPAPLSRKQSGVLRHQVLMEMSREIRDKKHFTGRAVSKGAAMWLL